MREWIRFDLIDHRNNFLVCYQVGPAIRGEIANTDGANPFGLLELPRGMPGAMDIAHRLVNHVSVHSLLLYRFGGASTPEYASTSAGRRAPRISIARTDVFNSVSSDEVK